MKKKIILMLMILIFSLLFTIITISGKKEVVKQEDESLISWVEKCSFKDIDDNWIYYVCIYYNKNDATKNIINATFNGINMKYSNLEDHYIPVMDEQGQIVDKFPAEHVSLVNGEKTSGEVKVINNLLEKKHFNRKIKMEDLDEIKLNYIDKNTLLELYNSALDTEEVEVGKYMNLSQALSIDTEIIDNIKFQLIYIMNYGNIAKVNIDAIYTDGEILSDKIMKNEASIEEQELQENLELIEKNILDKGSFEAGIQKTKNKKIEKINIILKKLENMK